MKRKAKELLPELLCTVPSLANCEEDKRIGESDYRKLPLPLSIIYCQMSPNIQTDWLKILYRAKSNKKFGENLLDNVDGNGLRFIRFVFVTGLQDRNFISFQTEFLFC